MLKYASVPQLKYSDGQQSRLVSRVPRGVYPIASANECSATPVVLYQADGGAKWGIHHMGAWRGMSPFKNHDGSVTWRADGSLLNPVGWTPRPLQRRR
jgi:hypothetical protein